MSSPWIFQQIKDYLATGVVPPSPEAAEKWSLILQHCRLAVAEWKEEEKAMRSLRARLMAYSKGLRREQSTARSFSARLEHR